MKKEAIIAVVIGILLGGVFALIIINKNKEIQLKKSKTIAPKKESNFFKKPPQVKIQQLEIIKISDGTIVNENKINLPIKAVKNSLVVIQSPIKSLVFKLEKDQFSVDFPLALGENVIRIAVYPQDRKLHLQEKELRVYYLKEQL